MVKKTANPTTSTASDSRPFNDAFAALRNFEITSKTGDVDRANAVKRDKQTKRKFSPAPVAEVPPIQDTGVATVDVAVQIVEFQKLVENGYGAKEAILNDIDQRLKDDLADKSDLERLADLQTKTDSLMASLSPEMLARQHEFIPQLEAEQEIQARIVALLSRLRLAKTAHAADRLIEASATVVDRERITRQVDEIERLVDDGTGELCAQDKLWLFDVTVDYRRRLTQTFINRDVTYGQFELAEEIEEQLTNAGKQEFFPRARALRQLADRQRKLLKLAIPTPEPKVEPPEVIERAPIVEPMPEVVTSTALVLLKPTQANSDVKDVARRAALFAEAANVVHEVQTPSLPPLPNFYTGDAKRAQAMARLGLSESLMSPVSAEDDPDLTADSDTENALAHLTDETAKADERTANRKAWFTTLLESAQANPETVTPPVEVLSAEAQVDMAGVESLLTELEQAFAVRNYVGAVEKFDDVALDLKLESERLEKLRPTMAFTELKPQLALVAKARKQLNNLKRRLPEPEPELEEAEPEFEDTVTATSKPQRRLHDIAVARRARKLQRNPSTSVENGAPKSGEVESETEETPAISQAKLERYTKLAEIRASLQSVQSALKSGSTDVGTMNDALIAAGVGLEALFNRVKKGREQGKKVVAFEAEVMNSLRELHELERQVEAATAKLTRADVEEAEAPQAVPVPVEKAVIDPLAQEVEEVKTEPKGVFAKARQRVGNALDYIWHGWDRVKREELQGELSPVELGDQTPTSTQEKVLRVSAGFLGGLASTVGFAIVPDLGRFILQGKFTEAEKLELKTVIEATFKEGAHTTGPETEIEGVNRKLAERKVRSEAMVERIGKSKYLTPEAKTALLDRLNTAMSGYTSGAEGLTATLRQEIVDILETHITPKISKGKLARETLNTSIVMGSVGTAFLGAAPFFVGLHVIRGPAYGVQSIIERRQKARREKARGERIDAGVMTVLKESFSETFDQLLRRSNKSEFAKSMDQGRAVATLTRVLGFSATGAMAYVGGELAVEAAEAAKAMGVDKLLHRAMEHVEARVSDIHEALFGVNGVEGVEGVSKSVPEVGEVVDTGVEAPTDVGVREVDVGGEVYLDTVPENSLVLGGSKYEGISHVLRRVILEQIKADPKAYEYKGHDDLSAFLHAKRLATMLVKNEDQLHNWLTEKAIGRVSMFPTMGEDGKWQITAVVDGKYKMSMKELAARGFIEPERVKSK